MTVSSGVLVALGDAIARIGALAPELFARVNVISGFLLLGAWGASKLLERKVAASLRLLLFAVVFVRLAFPHDWSSPVGLFGPMSLAAPVARPVGGALAALGEGVTLVADAPGPRSTPALWLGLGYLLVLSALLARWIAARWSLARQLRAARPITVGGASAGSARVTEHPRLGPLVAGVLRPRIVLPAAFVQAADAETMQFVLAHEAAHLARRDHWLVAAVQLATLVAWPVLPLWLAARQIRVLCELACDERVLAGRSADERRRYGEVLLRLSEGDVHLGAARLVPSFAWDLRRRLRALGRLRRWHRAGQWGFVTICGGLLLACSGAPQESPGAAPARSADGAPADAEFAPMPDFMAKAPSLQVTTNGALLLNDRPVTRDAFEAELRAILSASGGDSLRVASPPDRFPRELMDDAKRAGAKVIYLVPWQAERMLRKLQAAGAAVHVEHTTLTPSSQHDRCPPDASCGLRGPPGVPAPVLPLADAPGAVGHGPVGVGSLDKDVIRNVIRSHTAEVKTCYEAALARQPDLAGRLSVRFTIGRSGAVTAAAAEQPSRLGPVVAGCLERAVRGWVFPPPTGGIVIVSYPFVFADHDDAPPARTK
jgi:Zn-dependent protease with chaperone function